MPTLPSGPVRSHHNWNAVADLEIDGLSLPAAVALASCTDVCGRTASSHTQPGTHRRTCGVRTSRSSSLTCGPQKARTWIQSIALCWVTLNRWSINVDDSRQATSWTRQSSLSGANYCSVSSIAPWVSGDAAAWVGRPAARRINWTFDVKTAACELL